MRGILWGALFVSMIKDFFTVVCAVLSLLFEAISWICDACLKDK